MSNTAMTPDQFFDELDKLFGTDDGYENHLKRIKEAVSGDTQIRNHPYPTKLRNENEELKKQNEKLQGVIDSVKAHLDDEEHVVISTPLKYAPIVNAIDRLKKQNAELKELKAQNEKLKEELEWKKIDLQKEVKRNEILKEQNEELQTDLEDEKEEHENTKYDLQKLKDELEPLDEMMDKIKEVTEYEHVVDYVNGLHQEILELQEKLDEYKECAGDMTNVKVLVAQVAELEHALESTENYWKSNFENEQSTNKMLNEAIINHTEMLDEIREYLKGFDGDEVEVFDKIVKGSTD